ncbi:sulfurtransferase TusA family protein [Colwellia sp. E150_009]|jgi:TusA-related sulfurtransferase
MIFQYDASQEKCPLPLVNLRLILKKMKTEDVCVLKINDLGSKESIPKLLTKLGYCYNQRLIDHDIVEITLSKSE